MIKLEHTQEREKGIREHRGQVGSTKEADKWKLKYVHNCFKFEDSMLHSKTQRLPSWVAEDQRPKPESDYLYFRKDI